MQAIGNFVIARPVTEEETSAGGIVIPRTTGDVGKIAEVVSVGHGNKESGEIRGVAVGSRVLYHPRDGQGIVIKGERLLALHREEIMCDISSETPT